MEATWTIRCKGVFILITLTQTLLYCIHTYITLREEEFYDIGHVILEELPTSDSELEETEEDGEYIICLDRESEHSDN